MKNKTTIWIRLAENPTAKMSYIDQERLKLDLIPAETTFHRNGEDLVVTGGDGASVTLPGFFQGRRRRDRAPVCAGRRRIRQRRTGI